MAETETTANDDGGLLDPHAPGTPAGDAMKAMEEALDFGPAADPEPPVVQENDITDDQNADYTALVSGGFSEDEAKTLVKGGLSRKILANMKTGPKVEAAPDTGEQVADEPVRDSAIEALKAQIRALEERVGRSPDATDDLILAERAVSIFGEARWVQPDSEHARNRMRVKETVNTLRAGLKAQGRAVPPDAELVRKAIMVEFGDEIAELGRAPIAKRQSQFIPRPTARPSRDDVPGDDKARRNIRERMRALGL